MGHRGSRLHVPTHDAARVIELAALIEDRTPEEHEALLRMAKKLDRSEGARDGEVGSWEQRVLETWCDSEAFDVEDVEVKGAML